MLLLRDVGPWLVPEGDDTLPIVQHHRFVAHMARLHAAFWGFRDTVGLLPMAARYVILSPVTTEAECCYGGTHPVPRELLPEGWRRLRRAAPHAGPLALELVRDPSPLLAALESTPMTLLHGDWKAGNLGSHPDGRTILLDWAVPGQGPPCADLTWYLAINSARLPEPKEDTVDAYRRALEEQGVDTGGWWDRQLDLCLIGSFLQLGWEKTFGDPEELGWWEDRVMRARRWLP